MVVVVVAGAVVVVVPPCWPVRRLRFPPDRVGSTVVAGPAVVVGAAGRGRRLGRRRRLGGGLRVGGRLLCCSSVATWLQDPFWDLQLLAGLAISRLGLLCGPFPGDHADVGEDGPEAQLGGLA